MDTSGGSQTARSKIFAGICGFTTSVEATGDSDYNLKLKVESECPRVRGWSYGLKELNVLEELGRRHQSQIFAAAQQPQHRACTGCVVPAGVYKTMQAAAGLALPATSSIEIAVDEAS